MGRVEGEAAFVAPAVRGRSHAVRSAEADVDMVAVDRSRDIESIKYPRANPDDLKETVA